MTKELEPIKLLRDRVKEIASKLNLNLSVFNLIYPQNDDKPIVQVIMGVEANAIKSMAVIEQEKFDQQIAEIEKQFQEPEEQPQQEEDSSSNVLDELKSWLNNEDD